MINILTHGDSLRGDKTEAVVDVRQKDLNVDDWHQTRSVVDDVEPLHELFTGFQSAAVTYVRPLRQRYFSVFRSDETQTKAPFFNTYQNITGRVW